jgi:hypothetical protein
MRLLGIVVLLTFSVVGLIERAPAVETPQTDSLSTEARRIDMNARRLVAGAGSNDGAPVGELSIGGPSVAHLPRVRNRPKFQHILQSTPKDHGLAPEKSQESDITHSTPTTK